MRARAAWSTSTRTPVVHAGGHACARSSVRLFSASDFDKAPKIVEVETEIEDVTTKNEEVKTKIEKVETKIEEIETEIKEVTTKIKMVEKAQGLDNTADAGGYSDLPPNELAAEKSRLDAEKSQLMTEKSQRMTKESQLRKEKQTLLELQLQYEKNAAVQQGYVVFCCATHPTSLLV